MKKNHSNLIIGMIVGATIGSALSYMASDNFAPMRKRLKRQATKTVRNVCDILDNAQYMMK